MGLIVAARCKIAASPEYETQCGRYRPPSTHSIHRLLNLRKSFEPPQKCYSQQRPSHLAISAAAQISRTSAMPDGRNPTQYKQQSLFFTPMCWCSLSSHRTCCTYLSIAVAAWQDSSQASLSMISVCSFMRHSGPGASAESILIQTSICSRQIAMARKKAPQTFVLTGSCSEKISSRPAINLDRYMREAKCFPDESGPCFE